MRSLLQVLGILFSVFYTMQAVGGDEPAFRERMMRAGFEVPLPEAGARPPEDFIRAERERWGNLIKSAGIKAN